MTTIACSSISSSLPTASNSPALQNNHNCTVSRAMAGNSQRSNQSSSDRKFNLIIHGITEPVAGTTKWLISNLTLKVSVLIMKSLNFSGIPELSLFIDTSTVNIRGVATAKT